MNASFTPSIGAVGSRIHTVCAATPRQQQQPTIAARVGATALSVLLVASPVLAAKYKSDTNFIVPPVDPDPLRCEKAFEGNTIGQANGVVGEKGLDLRQCNLADKNMSEVNFAGAIMFDADFRKANLEAAIISKAYAVRSNFEGANLRNAVLDRSEFSGANFKSADLTNAILSGSVFTGANLDGAVLEDAVIGQEDIKKICLNKTLDEEGRILLGCRK